MATGSGGQAGTVPGEEFKPTVFDISVAYPPRMQDYWLDGKDNYAADRAACDYVSGAAPFMDRLARAERTFLASAVWYLAANLGIRQFLDIGTGLPAAASTHEVAQQAAPESRVVYVANDPVILAYARALLDSRPEGATGYIEADARDTGKILAQAAETLDFSRPAAVIMPGILQFVADEDNPQAVAARLVNAFPAGSCLAVSHWASDIRAETMAAAARRFNERSPVRLHLRDLEEFARFFDGLELTEPGVVPVNRWHPEPGQEKEPLPSYAALGRKPAAGR